MLGLVFVIPAMLMLLAAIFFYMVFGLLIGSFSIIGTAGKVAPNRVGITIAGGVITMLISFAQMGGGNGAGTLEGGILLVVALFFGSLAMLVLAIIFAATSTEEGHDADYQAQPHIERETKKSIEKGGWGLRKSGYSDNQHTNAQKARRKKTSPPTTTNNSW